MWKFRSLKGHLQELEELILFFLITALFSVHVSMLSLCVFKILIIDHSGSFVNLLCVSSLLYYG